MPVLRINAQGDRPTLHGLAQPLRPSLEKALRGDGPIVILLHGYKFRPHDARHCPHHHIFATTDVACRKAISWPDRLGLTAPDQATGLAIAFGWNARGSLPQARSSAKEAAKALSTLVRMIKRAAPDRPVHLFAHSMGVYLAMKALRLMDAGDIDRIIGLNPAVYRRQVEAGLKSAAGRTAEAFFMVSRENMIYDWMFEWALWPEDRGDRALGRGFSAANALTVDLSDPVSLDILAALGHPVAHRDRRFCHWSTYMRPGVFSFYQALLRQPAQMNMDRLKSEFTMALPDLPFLPERPPLSALPNQA